MLTREPKRRTNISRYELLMNYNHVFVLPSGRGCIALLPSISQHPTETPNHPPLCTTWTLIAPTLTLLPFSLSAISFRTMTRESESATPVTSTHPHTCIHINVTRAHVHAQCTHAHNTQTVYKSLQPCFCPVLSAIALRTTRHKSAVQLSLFGIKALLLLLL